MIAKDFGKYYVSCDDCGQEANTHFDSFANAIEWLKSKRWKFTKFSKDTWEHYCPECKDLQD